MRAQLAGGAKLAHLTWLWLSQVLGAEAGGETT
jgi:hypothetical protein